MTGSTRALLARAVPRIPRLARGALLSLLTIAAGVALLAVSGYLIQQASLRPPILSLDVAAVGVRLFSLLRATGRYFDRLATHDAVLRLLADTRVEVYEAMEPRTPGAYDQERIGDLMRNVTADVDSLQDFYARGLLPPAVAAIALLAGAFVAGLATASLGVTLFAVALTGALAVVLGAALSARGAAGRLAALSGALAADIADALLGRADLDGAGALDRGLPRSRHGAVPSGASRSGSPGREPPPRASFRSRPPPPCSRCSSRASWPSPPGSSPRSPSVSSRSARWRWASRLRCFPQRWTASGRGVPRPNGWRRSPPGRCRSPTRSIPWPRPTAAASSCAGSPCATPPEAGRRSSGVSLVLEPGRSVGIRGASGAGKSTLAAVLVRFRDYEGGEYLLGGVDVHRLLGSDVRARVGLLAQDAHVFATSVRENVRLARPRRPTRS